MDLSHPIEAVIPGAQGKVLQALLSAGRPLSTSDTARVASVSQPQASRVLARLVRLGLVTRTDVPPSALHAPVAHNAVIVALESIRTLRAISIEYMRQTIRILDPAPLAALLYGSTARGDGDELSDIDVVVVRPAPASVDEWSDSCARWAAGVETFTGSPVSLLELSPSEWRKRSFDRELWRAIEREGVDLLLGVERSPTSRRSG